MRNCRIFFKTFAPCLLLAGLPFIPAASAAELTAFEVMQKVDDRYDGDSSQGDYTMILVDKRDRQRIRDLRIFRKDYDKDSKALTVFDSPADIKGTGYLNFDWDDSNQDDDSWLYLPSLQRVKRIATSDTSDSFLGSDFTYADINGFELDWYDYTFINESEVIDGHECWLIEVIAKPEFEKKAQQATGYSKLHSWIRKDNFIQLRAQAWELKGNRIKYFTSQEIEEIEGVWTVKRLQAITTRNGKQEHASILQIKDIDYNVDVDDKLFTTEAMQRGL